MKVLHVFTLSTTARSFFDGQFRYLSEQGIRLHLATCDSPDVCSDFCERNHLEYTQARIVRRVDIIEDCKAIRQLIKLIRRERFDIVIGHTPKGALVSMIAAWIARTPRRIYYRHGLIYTTTHGLKRVVFKTVERLTSMLATQIINVSPSLSTLAVNDSLNCSSKQEIIGAGTCGGIDTISLFNPDLVSIEQKKCLKAELGIASEDYVVGFCGRLCKDKGIQELVDGFMLFCAQNPQISAKLLLIGQYDSRDILPDHIQSKIDTTPQIIATGAVEHNKLPLYLSIMDVFVFPSYREGFGISVIEASSMRVPILVSRSHGCVDSIRENVTGLYIDLTPQSISNGLTHLWNSPELRYTLGNNGREFVAGNFERTKMWPEVLKIYSKGIQ